MTATATRTRTTSRADYLPPRRGSRAARATEPPFSPWRAVRAALVLLLVLGLIIDQAWRPDLGREREVLATQVNEATARMDRLRAEIREVQAGRARIAANGVPPEEEWLWSNEPIRSTEHALHTYDRRIGHLEGVLARVVAQAGEDSAAIDGIDAGGGRRVPVANRLLTSLRAEVQRP